MSIDSYIDSILAAKGTQGGGNMLQDGVYVLALRNLTVEKSAAKASVFLKTELRVISSAPIGTIAPEFLKPNENPNPVPNPADSDAFRPFDIASAPGANDAKAFLCALLNVQPQSVEAKWLGDQIKLAVSPEQPLRGRLVHVTTYRTITKSGKNAGKPFVGYNYRNVAVTPEQIAEIRKELETGSAKKV